MDVQSQNQEITRPGPLFRILLLLLVILVPHPFLPVNVVSGDIDIYHSPGNAFFDMDVNRVIHDWTSWDRSGRSRTHPIYKYIAFIGIPVNHFAFGGENPTAAAQLICRGSLAVTAWLLAMLVLSLTRNQAAALLAAAIHLAMFSTVILSFLPDTAPVAGIFSILPYWYLSQKKEESFGYREAMIWALIALGAYAVTISQIMHPAFALAWRLYNLRATEGGLRVYTKPLIACAFAFLSIVVVLTELQQEIFEGTDKHYDLPDVVMREFKFFETDQLQEQPLWRGLQLANHFAFYNFLSPEPVIAEWNPPRDERVFISVTIVDENFRNWTFLQSPLILLHFAILVGGIVFFKWRWELLPIVLSIVAQLFLHYVYGREFIIYSPHWTPLIIALLICGASKWPKWLTIVLAVYAVALWANNLWVIDSSFELYRTEYPMDFVPEELK